MSVAERGVGYKILGVDNMAYGPVELPVLVEWVQDRRVTAGTWLYVERDDGWKKASQLPELSMFFQKTSLLVAAAPPANPSTLQGFTPGALRRVKILAEFSDAQLERLVRIVEMQRMPQWATVVKKGDHGEAMYLVLEGELRVRLLIAGKESTLATLGPGDFFGEISLFDSGPRSADVVANLTSTLLKVSATSFAALREEAPDVATALLVPIVRTLTARIRADNKRYQDSVAIARVISDET